MKPSLILSVSVRLLYPSIIVLSLYFLFAGHNQPGGGFVGGLAAAAAISLRYVNGGLAAVRRSFHFAPWTILGAGLAISVGTAIVPMLLGGAILEHGTLKLHPPLLGEVKATSALPFDIGVYAIVIGLVLMIFEAFGEDLEEEMEQVEAPTVPSSSVRAEYLPLASGQHGHASIWLADGDVDDSDDDSQGRGTATADSGGAER